MQESNCHWIFQFFDNFAREYFRLKKEKTTSQFQFFNNTKSLVGAFNFQTAVIDTESRVKAADLKKQRKTKAVALYSRATQNHAESKRV